MAPEPMIIYYSFLYLSMKKHGEKRVEKIFSGKSKPAQNRLTLIIRRSKIQIVKGNGVFKVFMCFNDVFSFFRK